jgi:hypothetical protein
MSGRRTTNRPHGNLHSTNTRDLGSARRFSPREITFCEGGDTSGLVQLERPPPSGTFGDTGDTVFMVNGGRWESSEATDRKLKMCLKAA